jgi:hypothetical protein
MHQNIQNATNTIENALISKNYLGGGGTFNVIFGIYVCQMTIFRGVLDNCPTYFLSPYYFFNFLIYMYILKPPYINYNPLFHIITYHVL